MTKPQPVQTIRCAKCGGESVEVSESQQMRTVAGRKRLHADVRCRLCKHQWWSRAKSAIYWSRKADERAKGAA